MQQKQKITQIFDEIKDSKNILLHLHPSPDLDSVGSALCFYHYLHTINKDVTLISGDSPLPKSFLSIPGADKIVKKNIFSLNLQEFDLLISLDSSSIDQISKIKPVIFPAPLKVIVIDHHSTNTLYGSINYVDSLSPATCQIIYRMLSFKKIPINDKMASCLFLGLYGDTGGFKYASTTSSTLEIAAKLAKIYPDFPKLIFNLENNDSPSRPRLIGLLLTHIKTYFNDNVAIAGITQKELEEFGIDPEVVSSVDVANTLKSVIGWNIGITMIETPDNKVKVSLRTRDPEKFDVGKIAVHTGFGGGHKAAAGASIPGNLDEARRVLLNAIKHEQNF